MHVEVHLHSDANGTRGSVSCWWLGADGLRHSQLMTREPLLVDGATADPWELLSALYVSLRALRGAGRGEEPQTSDVATAAGES